MVWNRIDLKNFAKDSMRKNYGACVLAAFLISLVLGLDAGTLSQLEDFEMYIPEGITVTVSWMTLLIAIFAGNVFTVGCCRFFVENREYRAPVSKVFHGFQSGHYTNAVWIMFLRDVKIVLWTFLFIIPGIVKTYEYRMVPYILADQPDISARDAFAISREMMRGQKVDAWVFRCILSWMVVCCYIYLRTFGDFLDRALCTCHQCGIVRSPSGELDEKTEYGAILWNTGGDILSI